VDNTNGNIYIGITKQSLKARKNQHKSHKKCMSREIIKNGDYKIELIEETEDKSRERYHILNTECVNRYLPGGETKEYYSNYRKNWRDNNKDKMKDYSIKRDKIRGNWYLSMGGSPYSNNLSLLKIDYNLFFYSNF
tara:strand:+ start:173 stop:580 length:408 start_codon:yes stop_codon:yes gene_type:complete